MIVLPVMSGLFLMVLIISFFFTIYTVIRQKKLSEIKADFVNNMTHEFKTPISTISISSEMLTKEGIMNSPEKISKYAKIIFDENNRLKNLVDRVLQIAVIDRKDEKLKLAQVDVHEVIRECADNFGLLVQERNGHLLTSPVASLPAITADRAHLTNMINNLLDNALKYSPLEPKIEITTFNQNGNLHIAIQDNGIGISREHHSDIFKKFHRLQRGDVHDVKGFGIGLYYVKTMAEKMGGYILLKSELNKGSCFTLIFPAIGS
jgi:two-component system phosphate regulon sensor histidine kinase PhoR